MIFQRNREKMLKMNINIPKHDLVHFIVFLHPCIVRSWVTGPVTCERTTCEWNFPQHHALWSRGGWSDSFPLSPSPNHLLIFQSLSQSHLHISSNALLKWPHISNRRPSTSFEIRILISFVFNLMKIETLNMQPPFLQFKTRTTVL